jgi:hypothetical protein
MKREIANCQFIAALHLAAKALREQLAGSSANRGTGGDEAIEGSVGTLRHA